MLLALLPFLEAMAHVGDLVGGIDVVPAVDGGASVDIEATYGLVLREGDGWEWICHEAVTSPGAVRAPRYVRSPRGLWLATVSDVTQGRDGRTLFRSTDAGCTWDDVAGTDGRLVAAAAFDPVDPTLAWAVTAEADGATAILGSADEGASWDAHTQTPGRRFHGLKAGGDALFATATDLGGTRGFLWHRPAGGVWAELEVPLPLGTEGARLRLLETRSAAHAWVVVDPTGSDILLETTDAGATWTEVLVASGAIVDGAADETGLYLAMNGLELVRVEDGVVSPPILDFPFSIGLHAVSDTLYAAPQSYLVGPLLSRTRPDGSFQTLAWPDDIVGPKECPANSDVATVCEPLWEILLPRLRGFDDPPIETAGDTGGETPNDPGDGAEADAAKGCGCAAAGAPVGAPLLLLPLLLRRRR